MTLPASIDITTRFDLSLAPYKFKLKNLTDFNTEGVTLSNVKGNFKIVNPQGTTVWNNTSLVTPDLYSFSISGITRTSNTATATTATSHGMETGDWVLVAGASQADYNILAQITKLSANSFSYTVANTPVTPATGTILGLKMSLNTKAIPLDVSTGMPITGNYTITLTTTVSGGVQPGTYAKDFLYTYAYVRPTVNIRQSLNCVLPAFYSTDNTTYMQAGVQPTVSRTHLINFPAASGLPQETYVTQTVNIYAPKVWNGIYTTSILSYLTYTFSDELEIYDKVSGADSFTASCDINLCKINCCLNELNQNYLAAKGVNDFTAEKYLTKLNRALGLKELYTSNINCGNDQEAQKNLQEIYNVTGCTGDCGCESETGQIIPYTGFIGKTILEWDANIANSENDYINYENYLYHVLSATTPGQNPVDNPDLFQVIGFAQFDYNVLKAYSVDEQFWFEGQLFKVVTATTAGDTPITARGKFKWVGGGVYQSNTVSTASPITLNKNSGICSFEDVITAAASAQFTISNTVIGASARKDVDLKLIYAGDGVPVISGYSVGANQIVITLFNFDPANDTSANIDIYFSIQD